jgi:hypothetical protein
MSQKTSIISPILEISSPKVFSHSIELGSIQEPSKLVSWFVFGFAKLLLLLTERSNNRIAQWSSPFSKDVAAR